MLVSTWKNPFLSDYLVSISTGAIPSADITNDLLTAHQKDNQLLMERLEILETVSK